MTAMTPDVLEKARRDVVIANRILAHEGVVDAYGHVSVRHPLDPTRYLLSRSRAPELVERGDIVEFDLEGKSVGGDTRAPYLERFIHGGLYEARPDVQSVVHNHSPSVIPFGVTEHKLKPLLHMCANIGHEVKTWDSHDKFGDTALLVETVDMGRDLAQAVGPCPTILMRGHGATVAGNSVRHAVFKGLREPEIKAGDAPVKRKRNGLPKPSTLTWTFVLKPPRLRPSAWAACPPFFSARRQQHLSRSLMLLLRRIGLHDGGRVGWAALPRCRSLCLYLPASFSG